MSKTKQNAGGRLRRMLPIKDDQSGRGDTYRMSAHQPTEPPREATPPPRTIDLPEWMIPDETLFGELPPRTPRSRADSNLSSPQSGTGQQQGGPSL